MTSASSGSMTPAARRRRIVVGISGASGAIYGVRLLRLLRELDIETHLVVSRSGQVTLAHETRMKLAEVQALADVCYANADIGAAISSGSFRVDGMIVAPCSIKTLSEIATGCTSSLLSRAADVMLKERRQLILVPRETPLSLIHLENLTQVARAGALVLPAMPSFYGKPQSLDDIIDSVVGRTLDHLGIAHTLSHRWKTPS